MIKRVMVLLIFFIALFNFTHAACINSDDIILKLSDTTNAHGEVWNGAGDYPVQVCYNETFGSPYSGSNPHDCLNGNGVLNLSSDTNAHAGFNDPNYPIDVCYGNLVCRITSSPCDSTQNEKPIVSLSDTTNAHLAKDSSYPQEICCKNQQATCNNDQNIDSGEQCDGSAFPDNNNTCVHYNSSLYLGGLLTCNQCIINTSQCISSNKSHIRIANPLHRQIYYNNTPLNFTFISDTSIVSATWNIDNGSLIHDFNFTHAYNTAGQKVITLNVTDISGNYDETQIVILVISSPGIFAYINQPSYNEIVISSNELDVNYSAEDSYVVNSSTIGCISGLDHTCCTTVTCLAGNCPTQTQNAPICSSNLDPIQLTGNLNQGFSSLLFNWTFVDLNYNFVGMGNASSTIYYDSPGNKTISLLLNYSSLSQPFSRKYTLLTNGCSQDGRTWYDIINGIQSSTSTQNSDKCKGPNGSPGGGDDCCPTNRQCNIDPSKGDIGCTFLCSYNSCNDYITETTCESNLCNMGKGNSNRSIGPDGCLHIKSNNGCLWNGTLCQQNTTETKTCGPDTVKTVCATSYEFSGDCTNGATSRTYREISTKVIGPDACPGPTEKQVLCGTSTLEAPFFTQFNALLVLISVALIYFIYIRIRKDKNEKI